MRERGPGGGGGGLKYRCGTWRARRLEATIQQGQIRE